MKFIWNNEETTSVEGQMLYQLSKDLLTAVLLYHSMIVFTKAFFALDSNLQSFIKITCFLKKFPDLQHAPFIKADAACCYTA